jgi:chemosensory pili system protein ChpC
MSTSSHGKQGHDDSPVQDIRGVLIQVEGARLLLPNATISEVLSFADPEPIADSPSWLLGRIRWRGWQLPLVSFARLAGLAEEQGGLGSKVVVLKALGDDAKLPHFALLTQGFPRLVTVSRGTLAVDPQQGDLPDGVQARVTLNDDAALIPDIDGIEQSIRGALAQAA